MSPRVVRTPVAAPSVARDRARRVVERAEHRVADIVAEMHGRREPGNLGRADHLGIHAEMLVHLGAPAHRAQRGIGMGERQMPALRIHQVECELLGEAAEQRHRFRIEPHAVRRQVVRADDGGVARGVAAGQVALVEHRHPADSPVARQIVRGRQAVPAAADDDHVVAALQLRRCGQLPSQGPPAEDAAREQR
jgi:hypothetical protein